MRARRLAVLAVLPLLVAASAAGDYARQWPLALGDAGAPAHEVVLDAGVYRAMHDPAGRDVDVLDARGEPQPSLLAPPPAPGARQVRIALPYFTLPVVTGDPGASRLVAETDTAGQLRRVELTGGVEVPGMPNEALLLDLAPARSAPVALELHWQPSGPVDRGYALEASDDLQRWTPLTIRGRIVDLAQGGRRLVRRRLDFEVAPRSRFLRLSPDVDGRRLHVHRVDAVVVQTTGPAVHWLSLAAQPAGVPGHRYRLDGRLPVRQVDVRLAGTGAMRWRLESRDGDADAWRLRASGSAFDVASAQGRRRAAPVALAQPVRDREWRLVPLDRAAPVPPTLRLGYVPERLVFLAQGTPPYRLVAGSAHARRVDAPVDAVIGELRRANGAGWRPPEARTGAPQVLAGDAALAPRRDWTAWTLWVVLGVGVLVLAGFAVRLLREPPRA